MEIAGEQHDRDEHHNHRREDQHANGDFLGQRVGFTFRSVDPVVAVGIGDGKDGQSGRGENGDDDPWHLRKQSGKHHYKTADDPHLTSKAVGRVPVFLAAQRPGNPDAHGAVGAAFGEIVAYGGEHQSQPHIKKAGEPEFPAQRHRVGDTADEDGGGGHYPEQQTYHFFALIPVFCVAENEKQHQIMGGQQQQRLEKYGGGLAAPSVRAVHAPMGGKLAGKPVPQKQPCGDGEKGKQRGDNQFFFVLLHHGAAPPFKSVSQSMISSKTEVFSS